MDLKEAKQMAQVIVRELDEKQAEEIKVIDIHEISVLADYFIIASGRNTSHCKALIDNVEDKMSMSGYEPKGQEGLDSFSWTLLDYNSVILHVFSEESREFYNLERIWKDGRTITKEELLG